MNKPNYMYLEVLVALITVGFIYYVFATNVSDLQSQARMARVKGDLKTLSAALLSYENTGRMLPDIQGYQTALMMANPQVLDRNLLDPFAESSDTLYSYVLSDNRKFFVVYSIGPNKSGMATVSNKGLVFIEGDPIYETNGSVRN